MAGQKNKGKNNIETHPTVKSTVKAVVNTNNRFNYIIDSSSDEEVKIKKKWVRQNEIGTDTNTNRHLRLRSRSMDVIYNEKVMDWLQTEQNDKHDDMNGYFKRHVNKALRNPHLQIPKPRSFERDERERQKKIIEQLANSDNLSLCSESGMARKKNTPRKSRRNDRRTPSPQKKERNRRKSPVPSHHSSHHFSRRSSKASHGSRKHRRRQDPYAREEPWRRYRSPSPTSDDRTGESDTEFSSDSTFTSVSTAMSRRSRRRRHTEIKKTERSGITAKASHKVVKAVTYPQFTLGQTSVFVASEIGFNQLTYDQFIAGEITTIARTTSRKEKAGRIRLLQNIAHWKLRPSVYWQQLRNVYALVLRDIENKVIDWTSDFNVYQHSLADKQNITSKANKTYSTVNNNNNWFCRQFQKQEGCPREPPHIQKIGNRDRQVQHFCAKCWLKEKSKKPHSESAPECPCNENQ